MPSLVTIAAVERHPQIIQFLSHHNTITINLCLRKNPIGNIHLYQYFSSMLIKISVEIFIQGNEPAYGIGNTHENDF